MQGEQKQAASFQSNIHAVCDFSLSKAWYWAIHQDLWGHHIDKLSQFNRSFFSAWLYPKFRVTGRPCARRSSCCPFSASLTSSTWWRPLWTAPWANSPSGPTQLTSSPPSKVSSSPVSTAFWTERSVTVISFRAFLVILHIYNN